MIKIVIAEDQGLLSSALATLLSMEEDLEIVGKASNGREAIELVELLQPDICLTDIEMPEMTGLDVAEKLQISSTKVMILTTFSNDGYFERAVRYSVSAYLLKDIPSSELVENIRGVMKGRKYFSPELVTRKFFSENNPLSKREIEVLTIINTGVSTKEAAEKLFLSHGTVRNYMSEILSKTGTKNRVEALAVAKEKGWM